MIYYFILILLEYKEKIQQPQQHYCIAKKLLRFCHLDVHVHI